MTDFQELVLVFGGLYVLECVLWLPLGSFVFRRPVFGRWRSSETGWPLSLIRTILHLGPLAPPFGRLFAGGNSALRIDMTGIWTSATDIETGSATTLCARWTETFAVTADGKKLRCNGKPIAQFVSPVNALRIANHIARLREATESDRKALLATEFRRCLDDSAIRERLVALRNATRRLNVACQTEFALLIIAFPVLASTFGYRILLMPLALMLLLSIFIAHQFDRAFQRLHGWPHPERGLTKAMMILWPISAIRAGDHLAQWSLSEFHPLAISSVLCSREEFLIEGSRYLRKEFFQIPMAVPSDNGGQPDEGTDWYSLCWREALGAFLERNGWSLEQLLRAPRKESADSRSYCPRCCYQYRLERGYCAECRLSLVSLDMDPSPIP